MKWPPCFRTWKRGAPLRASRHTRIPSPPDRSELPRRFGSRFVPRFLRLGVHARPLAAASPSFLLFSNRQFSAFAESQCLFQRIFVGIVVGLRALSRWLCLK